MHSCTHFRACIIQNSFWWSPDVHLSIKSFQNYDGVWPSRLNPRSTLSLINQIFSNHVMVRDPLGMAKVWTSLLLFQLVMVCDPLGSVQGPTSIFFKSCDGAWPSRHGQGHDLTFTKSQFAFNFVDTRTKSVSLSLLIFYYANMKLFKISYYPIKSK